ncbi:hypothetical protein KY285_019042 [Solanum tuberosum]|nr:hypothetical protein KY285_019042 [Solanum tuberosum]
MNYLLKERKEVESDSVSVHHRDSEVAVSVAVFDDVDVSNREDQGRYAPESKKFQNPGLSSIATYSKTKTAATLASVCSYSEDRGIPGGRDRPRLRPNSHLRHTRIDREPKEGLEKGKRHLNLIAPFLVPERKSIASLGVSDKSTPARVVAGELRISCLQGSVQVGERITSQASHLEHRDARIKAFCQRAKAIAQERGFSPGKCDAVKDAADYVAGDVKDMPAASQLRFLTRLRRDLENGNSETWGLIEREVRRWRPGSARNQKGLGARWSKEREGPASGTEPPDERSTELHPYSPGLCTSLSPGGWPPILDLPISKKIPGSIWFSIKSPFNGSLNYVRGIALLSNGKRASPRKCPARLNPSSERIVELQSDIWAKLGELMPNKSAQEVLEAAEVLHGESNDIDFLDSLLKDLNQNGVAGEAYKDAVDLVKDLVSSPLEQFEIIPLIPMKIGNLYFSFTNPSLFMLLTLSLVLLLVYFVTKKGGGNSVPNAWQSLVELIYDFVLNPSWSIPSLCFRDRSCASPYFIAVIAPVPEGISGIVGSSRSLPWNAVREPGAIELFHNPRRRIGLFTSIITSRWEMELRSRCEPTYEWNFVDKQIPQKKQQTSQRTACLILLPFGTPIFSEIAWSELEQQIREQERISQLIQQQPFFLGNFHMRSRALPSRIKSYLSSTFVAFCSFGLAISFLVLSFKLLSILGISSHSVRSASWCRPLSYLSIPIHLYLSYSTTSLLQGASKALLLKRSLRSFTRFPAARSYLTASMIDVYNIWLTFEFVVGESEKDSFWLSHLLTLSALAIYRVKVDPKSGVLSGLLLMGFRPLGQVHGVYHQKSIATALFTKELGLRAMSYNTYARRKNALMGGYAKEGESLACLVCLEPGLADGNGISGNAVKGEGAKEANSNEESFRGVTPSRKSTFHTRQSSDRGEEAEHNRFCGTRCAGIAKAGMSSQRSNKLLDRLKLKGEREMTLVVEYPEEGLDFSVMIAFCTPTKNLRDGTMTHGSASLVYFRKVNKALRLPLFPDHGVYHHSNSIRRIRILVGNVPNS